AGHGGTDRPGGVAGHRRPQPAARAARADRGCPDVTRSNGTLSERVLRGDHRAIARVVTLIERADPRAPDVLASLYPAAGRAAVVGITGPAGSGKSTLTSRLARQLRQRG